MESLHPSFKWRTKLVKLMEKWTLAFFIHDQCLPQDNFFDKFLIGWLVYISLLFLLWAELCPGNIFQIPHVVLIVYLKIFLETCYNVCDLRSTYCEKYLFKLLFSNKSSSCTQTWWHLVFPRAFISVITIINRLETKEELSGVLVIN